MQLCTQPSFTSTTILQYLYNTRDQAHEPDDPSFHIGILGDQDFAEQFAMERQQKAMDKKKNYKQLIFIFEHFSNDK
jgi:hypothetical protein